MKKHATNLFDQINGFYESIWCDPKLKVQHCSFYMFLLNQCNRSRWPEWISIPRDIGMNGAKISRREMYYSTIETLKELKLIDYVKSKNQYEASVFKVICLYGKRDNHRTTTDTTTDTTTGLAPDNHRDQHRSSTGLAPDPYKDIKTLDKEDKETLDVLEDLKPKKTYKDLLAECEGQIWV